jgi:hypothetical protein
LEIKKIEKKLKFVRLQPRNHANNQMAATVES